MKTEPILSQVEYALKKEPCTLFSHFLNTKDVTVALAIMYSKKERSGKWTRKIWYFWNLLWPLIYSCCVSYGLFLSYGVANVATTPVVTKKRKE